MAKPVTTSSNSLGGNSQMYVLAVICFVVGIAIGYFFRGSGTPAPTQQTAAQQPVSGMGTGEVTAEQLKHMADKQVEPLLARLKTTPNDPALLAQIGNAYYDAQIYPDAVGYYGRALELAPKNSSVRTDLGTAYWYMGEADKAIEQFDAVLKDEPNMSNALFNRGMVKWQGKMDVTGAVADWQKLLDTNPAYDGRDKVVALIAKAKEHTTMKPGTKTDKPATIR
jgi:cytochrome c-type biogenesis protein CcmH/NrfG